MNGGCGDNCNISSSQFNNNKFIDTRTLFENQPTNNSGIFTVFIILFCLKFYEI